MAVKRGNPCLKCGSKSIAYLPGGLLADQNYAVVAGFLALGSTRFRIARYVCGTCGYTEEWVDREDDLEKVRRLVDK